MTLTGRLVASFSENRVWNLNWIKLNALAVTWFTWKFLPPHGATFGRCQWSRDLNGLISFIVQWKCLTKYLSWIEFKLAVTWSNFEKFCRRTAPLLADVNPLTTEWRKSRTEAALTLHESNKWQSVAKVGNVVIYTCSRRILVIFF